MDGGRISFVAVNFQSFLNSRSYSRVMTYSGTGDKDDLDNHSDQCNPNNDEYDGYQDD